MSMITTARECEEAAKILNLQDISKDLQIDGCSNGCMYGCTYGENDLLRFGSPESPWYPAKNVPCGSPILWNRYDCICKYTGKIILIGNQINSKDPWRIENDK